MKKLFLILLTGLISIISFAQDKTSEPKKRIQEIGIGFANLNNFNLLWKVGKSNSLWRFSLLAGHGSSSKYSEDDSDHKIYGYNFGIKAGHEFRNMITQNFEFRYGLDLDFRYLTDKREVTYSNNSNIIVSTILTNTYRPGINFVIGFNYVIKEKIIIGAEALPFFSYDTAIEEVTTTADNEVTTEKIASNSISFGLSNTSVLVSLAYRF